MSCRYSDMWRIALLQRYQFAGILCDLTTGQWIQCIVMKQINACECNTHWCTHTKDGKLSDNLIFTDFDEVVDVVTDAYKKGIGFEIKLIVDTSDPPMTGDYNTFRQVLL
jgi:hypothetical protein